MKFNRTHLSLVEQSAPLAPIYIENLDKAAKLPIEIVK
jgi:hypothetical protein